MLDLFCGRFGWGRAFAQHGWEVIGVDLIEPTDVPLGCVFQQYDVQSLYWEGGAVWGTSHYGVPVCLCHGPDFICASSPCEQFSVHGMKHFHPNPPYPSEGVALFNHTREMCEAVGVPYVMENVRPAQQFVGNAKHHCGPFYLWGSGVPPLMPQNITKGIDVGSSKIVKTMTLEERRKYRRQFPWNQAWSSSPQRGHDTAKAATIPPELAGAVADYAERILAHP